MRGMLESNMRSSSLSRLEWNPWWGSSWIWYQCQLPCSKRRLDHSVWHIGERHVTLPPKKLAPSLGYCLAGRMAEFVHLDQTQLILLQLIFNQPCFLLLCLPISPSPPFGFYLATYIFTSFIFWVGRRDHTLHYSELCLECQTNSKKWVCQKNCTCTVLRSPEQFEQCPWPFVN